MIDGGRSTTDPVLSAALTRYLARESNRGHYDRSAESGDVDGVAYATHLVRLRREEIGTWRSTWWRRLTREPLRVLDAGCGPGFVSAALADELPDGAVVGIDVEPEAISVAHLLARDRPNLLAVEGSLEDLPPALGTFDLIVCRTTLEHVYDPRTALAQLLGALNPGGALFLETPNYLFPFEPHVRLLMPPKCPKWLLRLECRAFGRDADFVDHLQFACDPRTLSRWARASGSVDVTDLMAEKVLSVLRGEQRSAVGWRQRAARTAAALAGRNTRLEQQLARLPVWPSAQLLIVRRDDAPPAAPAPDRELLFLRAITGRLPDVPHASGVVNRIIKPWYLRKPRPEVIADVRGLRMRLKPEEAIDGAYLFYPHLYDRHEIEFMRDTLRPGDTFIDVGAHIGFYSLAAAQCVASHGHVLSIEPEAWNFQRLEWNVEANGMSQVRLVRGGVSSIAGVRRLAVQGRGNRGGSSFGTDSVEVQEVECQPLAVILDRQAIERIDGIKLDIEGEEADVLEHFFAHVPSRLHPRFLIVEEADLALGHSRVAAILEQNGYVLRSRHTGNAVNSVFVRRVTGKSR